MYWSGFTEGVSQFYEISTFHYPKSGNFHSLLMSQLKPKCESTS